jgi:hypothetical protein
MEWHKKTSTIGKTSIASCSYEPIQPLHKLTIFISFLLHFHGDEKEEDDGVDDQIVVPAYSRAPAIESYHFQSIFLLLLRDVGSQLSIP